MKKEAVATPRRIDGSPDQRKLFARVGLLARNGNWVLEDMESLSLVSRGLFLPYSARICLELQTTSQELVRGEPAWAYSDERRGYEVQAAATVLDDVLPLSHKDRRTLLAATGGFDAPASLLGRAKDTPQCTAWGAWLGDDAEVAMARLACESLYVAADIELI